MSDTAADSKWEIKAGILGACRFGVIKNGVEKEAAA